MRESTLLTLLMIILGPASLIPVKAQDDLIYVAVDPCRIVDTRNAGGAITANTFRNFRVAGTMGELAVQGGNTDCLDPKTGTEPVAISAYVVAVPATSSTSGGVLTAYPSDQLPPPVGAGSTVNFAAGQTIGNTTNITLCNSVSCPTDGEFAILARSTNQHVVIDVQGYFYPVSIPAPVETGPSWQIFRPGTGQPVKWVKHNPNPRFSIYDAGTNDPLDDLVWDRETGLVWQRSPDNRSLTFFGTTNGCNVLEAGGRWGWRAFTVEEGATLLADGTPDNLPIDHPFLNVRVFYWSSTTNPDDAVGSTGRGIRFDLGVPTVNDKFVLGRVWCVRGGVGHDTKYAN